jgi:hypothetical protein
MLDDLGVILASSLSGVLFLFVRHQGDREVVIALRVTVVMLHRETEIFSGLIEIPLSQVEISEGVILSGGFICLAGGRVGNQTVRLTTRLLVETYGIAVTFPQIRRITNVADPSLDRALLRIRRLEGIKTFDNWGQLEKQRPDERAETNNRNRDYGLPSRS